MQIHTLIEPDGSQFAIFAYIYIYIILFHFVVYVRVRTPFLHKKNTGSRHSKYLQNEISCRALHPRLRTGIIPRKLSNVRDALAVNVRHGQTLSNVFLRLPDDHRSLNGEKPSRSKRTRTGVHTQNLKIIFTMCHLIRFSIERQRRTVVSCNEEIKNRSLSPTQFNACAKKSGDIFYPSFSGRSIRKINSVPGSRLICISAWRW